MNVRASDRKASLLPSAKPAAYYLLGSTSRTLHSTSSLVVGFEIGYGILASEASEGSTDERSESVGVSDNDRKYYSLERAKEALGYDPQDNSAEWDGDDHVADYERDAV